MGECPTGIIPVFKIITVVIPDLAQDFDSLKEVKEELLDAVEVLREIRDYDSDDLEDRDDTRWGLAHDWLRRNNK